MPNSGRESVPPDPPATALAHTTLILNLLFLFSSPSWAEQQSDNADILLLEDPSQLRVMDQYQRTVASPSDAGISAFAPIVLRNFQDVLNDGFTPCARVEVNGKVLYLIKESDSRLAGAGTFGYQTIYRQAAVVRDTVEILRAERVLIQSVRRSRSDYLASGERLERLFIHDGLTYVRRFTGSRADFGWVALTRAGRGTIWKVSTAATPLPLGQTARLMPRVKNIIRETNTVLAGLFSLLNQNTGQQKATPHWEVKQDGSIIICILQSEIPPASFTESSAVLAKSLETLALGTRRKVLAQPGRIELR
jgi:hypothetical protein